MMTNEVRTLDDVTLIKGLRANLGEERRALVKFLRYLAEAGERRLYAERGFPSMYEFCRGELGLSEYEANTRPKVARLGRQYPLALALLGAGTLLFTVLNSVANYCEEQGGEALLLSLVGKTTREVDRLAAGWELARVRPRTGKGTTKTRKQEPLFAADETAPDGTTPPGREPARKKDRIKHETPDLVRISFSGDTALVDLVEEARALGIAKGHRTLEDVIGAALRAYVQENNPLRRATRREAERAKLAEAKIRRQVAQTKQAEADAKAQRQAAQTMRPKAEPIDPALEVQAQSTPAPPAQVQPAQVLPPQTQPMPKRSRYIPVQVRDQSLIAHDGQCCFVSDDKRRCTERAALQGDHRLPFARGGSSTDPRNIRPLCAVHNRLEAERVFGRDFIASRIAARRSAARSYV